MQTALRATVALAMAFAITAGCSGDGKKTTRAASTTSTTAVPDETNTTTTVAGAAGTTPTGPTAPASTPASPVTVAALGKRIDTAKGNVVVYAYESPASPPGTTPRQGNRFVDIDAEGCAGPDADAKTGIGPVNFYLQIGRLAYRPIAASKAPALQPTQLDPGTCARGWVTFEIPGDAKPPFVYFSSSKVIAWQLP
jgi:hypothetical protein